MSPRMLERFFDNTIYFVILFDMQKLLCDTHTHTHRHTSVVMFDDVNVADTIQKYVSHKLR